MIVVKKSTKIFVIDALAYNELDVSVKKAARLKNLKMIKGGDSNTLGLSVLRGCIPFPTPTPPTPVCSCTPRDILQHPSPHPKSNYVWQEREREREGVKNAEGGEIDDELYFS